MAAIIQSTMIRASAGSGKTFQLANRFLALLVLGEKPEKMIALTFTRKAAGEFTGRIMTRLAEGASSEDKACELAAELEKVILGKGVIPALIKGNGAELPEMSAQFFQQKLADLIAVLDRLALSTLDSYFVRIVRNFYLELGLSGFELMEDAAISAERMAVMKVIFSHRKTGKQARDVFIQSFKQATWGEQENRLCKPLEDFIQMHQNRWLANPDAHCWGSEEGLWPDGCPYAAGNRQEYAQELRRLMGKPYTPHATYMKGWLKVCDLLEQNQPGVPFTHNTQLNRALPLWDQYQQGGKVEEKNKYDISPEIGAVMTSLLGSYIRSEIEIRMKRTQGLYALVSAYEERYRDHVRNRGKLCFSDLTMLLAGEGAMQIWNDDDRNLIDFRLDARYDHWLLDEFQDTSRPQWQAVQNLIDEIMQDAEGRRSVFIVGDGKQSIYGWRGGEPRLFNELKNYYGDRLAEWDMDLSYRSTQPVLDLVNSVCDLSDAKWQAIFPPAAIKRWQYHEHAPHADGEGHAMVVETGVDLSATSPKEQKEARYRCMAALIEKVKPLERGMSCAILVSKNSQVTEIVHYLRKDPHYLPVASESETYLADGPIGSVMLDLFRWLRNPQHIFGYTHVCSSPLGSILSDICDSIDRQQQWQWLTNELAQVGVQNVVSEIITRLRQCQSISDYGNSRLDEIQGAAADFSSSGGDLNEWVQLLEARSIKETSHEGMIQVMTIHKCKGLGFDMVILPELGHAKPFTSNAQVDALERKGGLGAIEYVIKKPNKEICQADKGLAEMVDTWAEDQCYERFCNLYVALTRAKKATYCILDPVKTKWEAQAKYNDWIREATAGYQEHQLEINQETCNVIYQSGEWLKYDEAGRVDEVAQPTVFPELRVPTARMSRKLASEAKEYRAGDLLRASKGVHFGDQVHRQFECITWLDELPEMSARKHAQLVVDCLQVSEIRRHFERPASQCQLLREQPIETQENDRWISGVIDRAVIMMDEGMPSSISIIDYKTDEKETAESLKLKYASQLYTYRAAMHRITGVPESKIECFLLSTSLKQMVKIE
ncbi:MAG: UvrD-helicase domain-containing protein [Akkermansiaceae bacterium]|nr:UvrD-helicase domain-containing protein [Akkermansiaceae bacterium]